MALRRGRAKSKAKRRAAPASAVRRPGRTEELVAGSKALLGRDEEARSVRRARDDASMQDPLGDWPEE